MIQASLRVRSILRPRIKLQKMCGEYCQQMPKPSGRVPAMNEARTGPSRVPCVLAQCVRCDGGSHARMKREKSNASESGTKFVVSKLVSRSRHGVLSTKLRNYARRVRVIERRNRKENEAVGVAATRYTVRKVHMVKWQPVRFLLPVPGARTVVHRNNIKFDGGSLDQRMSLYAPAMPTDIMLTEVRAMYASPSLSRPRA